ncbi:MAG: hypothetical protein JWP44_4832, partial [Mucilaginibacter sp.]|nr:hypothetical protein [Mucilaginibacter sp.]
MSKYQLLLPKMGESVAEATIIKWLKKPGDYVEADEAVMEIATDKVDSEVPSPVSGKLAEQLCKEDDVVQVGSVIAVIETEAAEEEAPVPQPYTTPVTAAPQEAYVAPQPQAVVEPATPEVTSQPIPGIDQLANRPLVQYNDSFKSSPRFYSPLVKQIATQENISIAELEQIPGNGAEGRLTKDDLLDYIKTRPAKSIEQVKPEQPVQDIARDKPAQAISVSGGDEIIEMDRMRRLIADHMVMSKQTSPHVTSFVEADVTSLVMWRDKVKANFEKREGEKITFTPIFIEAVVKAIKDMPMINVSVNGTQIIKKAAVNISMATALPNGN